MINDLWIAYCYFHLGEFKCALDIYEEIINKDPWNKPPTNDEISGKSGVNESKNSDQLLHPQSEFLPTIDDVYLCMSCCQFFMGMYKESEENSSKSKTTSSLKNRLAFHLAHKSSNEKTLMNHHQQLQDVLQDQLCLASIHYLRSHYQEAIDIYKKILLDHRDFLALNVYVALCYYKLDYYDVSQEVLAVYLHHYPDSVTAVNLKACNHYRLYNGKAAEVCYKKDFFKVKG